ncbi:meiosis-specific coiled-coil domain-containing protein MEIOC-like [Eublepharis macularius]|uniref:Meiosis-specific coiled-coil domain-containing protein MEIOC-like n=1 Tax=Eublepharis macularius TaxID=481883 RepID=A0AA97K1U8_EUBMA|nr:meiosis-specific coiled-coil domain-containing protein MEIOC-like [Eublepharis macularius]
MVADGARSVAVPLPGGTPPPEVKPMVKNLNFCLFGNAAHCENRSCEEDPVKQSETFSYYKPQVNSAKQEMNTQLFSPLFGGITNTPPNVESPQLYSSWSTCGDETSAVASLQDCRKKRAQINLSYSGSGPDMFGLVSSILEEPNKQEPVTDWNALSRLFPPMWSSENSFSGLFPKSILENKDLTNLVSTLNPYEENTRDSTESLKKDLDDFRLTGTWHALSDACTQSPEKVFRDAVPTNKAFKRNGINHQDSLEYQNIHSYDKKQLNNGSGKSRTDFHTFSSQARIKGSTNKEYPKMDKARGMLGGNDPEGPSQYFSQLCNNSDGIWDLVTEENNLSPERYTDFTTVNESQQFSFPSFYICATTSNKENSFPDGMNSKWQETYPQNAHHSINTEITFCNPECKIPEHPSKESCNSLPLKPIEQNANSSYNGYTWLDTKILNTATASCVTYGKQMNSQLSSVHSSVDHSVAQPSCPQMSPVSSSRKNGKLQMPNNIPSSSGLSTSEKHKKQSPMRCSQNASSVTSEGLCGKIPVNASPSWLSQQCSSNESAKYHRFHNKQSQYSTNERTVQNDRRGKNNRILHPGYAGLNQAQFDALRRKQDQNGSLADFINPSFLPLFPLVSGYTHAPNFPPFNSHPFPSPVNVAFSPLPFPFSELVDLFHYDDFHHLSPLITDLFCGDVAAPCFAFPPPFNNYRPPKNRSGPANELHIHLEECYDQWRALERERKKAEADLARNFPGKRISSSNNTPFSKLPAKPSRVDRLIVDQFREQARVHTLIGKMGRLCGIPVHTNIAVTLARHLEAIHATQARRKDEIVNAANPQRQGTSRYSNEKDVLALAAAIKDLAFSTRKTRTALWCALQMTLPKTSASASVKEEDVERALRELCPVTGHLQGKTGVDHEDKENKRENHEEPQRVIR